MKRWIFVLPFILIGLLLLPATQVSADAPTSQYFAETGHTVAGPFYTFFKARGGLDIFGYPRTDAFPEGKLTVQYFQRAKMELHPENREPYKVQLALLGDLLDRGMPPISAAEIPSPKDPYRRYYKGTGHTISYAFLTYFDANGGLDTFGYPISELVIVNGFVTQYFQRARVEWHPELGGIVLLGLLGDEYIDKFKVPAIALERTKPPTIYVIVQASVKYSMTGVGGWQTVYVYVRDADNKPIGGAEVAFTLRYKGQTADYTCPPTDAASFTMKRFSINRAWRGSPVTVEVTATYQGQSGKAQTRFTQR